MIDSSKPLDHPKLIVPKRFIDDRGWLSETFQDKRYQGLGITCQFVQDNQSHSKRAGTLRGLHFQTPPAAQAKLVGILRGRVLEVVVDIRRGSPTFGKYVSAELSADGGQLLYVPVGFAHGFLTLENDVAVMYKVSDYYAPAHDRGIRWDDRDIAISWPIEKASVITSEKDSRLPPLGEFSSPFAYDGHPLTTLTVVNL